MATPYEMSSLWNLKNLKSASLRPSQMDMMVRMLQIWGSGKTPLVELLIKIWQPSLVHHIIASYRKYEHNKVLDPSFQAKGNMTLDKSINHQ
jgi:hypothetical protein